MDGSETFVEAETSGAAPRQDEVFVRAVDLPTLSMRQARAAIAQQLDILSPLPPAEVAASVVLIGPTEEGLNRYAVGLAPKRQLAEAPAGARTVTLIGRLDGQIIAFRFPRSGESGGLAERLELATVVGACLAILLAGANLRVDREIDAVQAKVDIADALVQQRSHEAAGLARVAGAWRAAAATRKASLVDCALTNLVKASGGPATLTSLSLAGGQLTLHLAAPPSESAVAALKAAGVMPALAAAPLASSADPALANAPAVAAQDFQTSAAACR